MLLRTMARGMLGADALEENVVDGVTNLLPIYSESPGTVSFGDVSCFCQVPYHRRLPSLLREKAFNLWNSQNPQIPRQFLMKKNSRYKYLTNFSPTNFVRSDMVAVVERLYRIMIVSGKSTLTFYLLLFVSCMSFSGILDIDNSHIGQYCVVSYDGRPYPGIIQDVDTTDFELNVVHFVGENLFVRTEVTMFPSTTLNSS
ncbi:uncharacterized protein LOC128547264 [Mercenaria mercenaria]|uniref:uncharacterized protein LOC128547264 n=1 Tax=Mercenaria mercenaria TaxID=6596 RepID=UPI00234F6D21|nr:uncharacterized protein LOC128547264 [Mercenaria mercenaria]